jgi:hypothetical protein
MIRLLSLWVILFILGSCLKGNSNVEEFRVGHFKTVLDDKGTVSMAIRNDSLQIESFQNKKDTFDIKWVSPFEYVLRKKNPQTLLDSTDFHVKIISISENSYEFKAYYMGSNFQQKGTAYKVD